MGIEERDCSGELWGKRMELIADPQLFQDIHVTKSFFVNMLTALGNQLSKAELERWHEPSNGIKVSQGNSLQQCPYQVLDIIRDFDPETGLNIRVLNWWGRGLFLFIFLGNLAARKLLLVSKSPLTSYFYDNEYLISLAESPWDYKGMVIQNQIALARGFQDWESLIEKGKHFQALKKLPFGNTALATQTVLLREITRLGSTLIR